MEGHKLSTKNAVVQPIDRYMDYEGDKTYLLYSVAGESGIAVAEISFQNP